MAGTYYNFSGTSCSTSILTQLTTDATNSAPVLGEVYSGYTSGDFYTVTDTGAIGGTPLGIDVDTNFDFVNCPGQCYEISNGDLSFAYDVSYIDNLGASVCTTLAQGSSPGDTQIICISAGTSTSIIGHSTSDGSCGGFAVVISIVDLATFCQNPGDCVAVSPTPTPTNTVTPNDTPTQTPTNTETPTQTPTNTETPTQTPTTTTTPIETPTQTPTNTETPTQTPTPTPTPTEVCDETYCLSNCCTFTLFNESGSIKNYSYYDCNGVLQSGTFAGGTNFQFCSNQLYGAIFVDTICTLVLNGCCTGP
jgi:hypothetical protein